MHTTPQETIGKSQVTEMNLQDQLRSARDAGDNQVTELRHMMEGMKAHHEFEKKSLREALQQVSIKLAFHMFVPPPPPIFLLHSFPHSFHLLADSVDLGGG